MEALWEAGEQGAGEVVRRVDGQGWAARTVKTLLGRLVEKQAAAARPDPADARRFLYKAAVAREALRRAESRSFVRRVFAGEPAAAVMHLVAGGGLSAEEIEALRRELDKLDGGGS